MSENVNKIHVSIIITCHNEGNLLSSTFGSVLQNLANAHENNINCEVIAIADSADEKTICFLNEFPKPFFKIFQVNFSDPGLSRNFGVSQCHGEYIALVDGDDLLCESWISKSHTYLKNSLDQKIILHPELNIYFGSNRLLLFKHIESNSERFELLSMLDSNKWTILCFANRKIFIEIPFEKNQINEGIGHEDWSWNCTTLYKGIKHKTVPQTCHFIRQKLEGSQLELAEDNLCLIRRNALFSIENIINLPPPKKETLNYSIPTRTDIFKIKTKKFFKTWRAPLKVIKYFYNFYIKAHFLFLESNKSFNLFQNYPWVENDFLNLGELELDIKKYFQQKNIKLINFENFDFGRQYYLLAIKCHKLGINKFIIYFDENLNSHRLGEILPKLEQNTGIICLSRHINEFENPKVINFYWFETDYFKSINSISLKFLANFLVQYSSENNFLNKTGLVTRYF